MEKITQLNKIFNDVSKDIIDIRSGKLSDNNALSICRLVNSIIKLDNAVLQRLKIKERANRNTK